MFSGNLSSLFCFVGLLSLRMAPTYLFCMNSEMGVATVVDVPWAESFKGLDPFITSVLSDAAAHAQLLTHMATG